MDTKTLSYIKNNWHKNKQEEVNGMKMKRTMTTEDMQFIYGELVNLNQPDTVNDAEHVLVEAEMGTRKISNQYKVVTIAEKLIGLYQSYKGEEEKDQITINYESFLEQTKSVLMTGNYLNDRNYKSLLVLVSSVAFNTHKVKMESLVTEGYWEGITLEDLPMQQYNTGTAIQNG